MPKKIGELQKQAVLVLHDYGFSGDIISEIFKGVMSRSLIFSLLKKYKKVIHINEVETIVDKGFTYDEEVQKDSINKLRDVSNLINQQDILADNQFNDKLAGNVNQNNEKSILDDENNFERLKRFIQKYNEILNLNMSNKEILNAANKIKSDIKSLPKEIQDDLTMEKIRDTIKDLSNENLSLNRFLDSVKYNLS